MRCCAPAAERNREPILSVLQTLVPSPGRILEIASGTGQHVTWFAKHLPQVVFQPSDVDPDARASIIAWRDETGLDNVLDPLSIDASKPFVHAADLVLCINMIHIAPWPAAVGLFAGAQASLPPAGQLLLYGPFRFDGTFSANSNERFDRDLRSRNPSWGIRDVKDVDDVARLRGFARAETIAMPANNHCLLYRNSADA